MRPLPKAAPGLAGRLASLQASVGIVATVDANGAEHDEDPDSLTASINPDDIVRDERGRFARKDGGGKDVETQPDDFKGFSLPELIGQPSETQKRALLQANADRFDETFGDERSKVRDAYRYAAGDRKRISEALKSDDPDPAVVATLQLAHASALKIADERGFTHLRMERGNTDHAGDPEDPFTGNERERFGDWAGKYTRATPGTSGVTSWTLAPPDWLGGSPGESWGDHVHQATVPMDQVVGRLGIIENEMLVARDPKIVDAIMAWPNDVDGVPAAPFNTFPERSQAKTASAVLASIDSLVASINPDDIVRDERGRFASKGSEGQGEYPYAIMQSKANLDYRGTFKVPGAAAIKARIGKTPADRVAYFAATHNIALSGDEGPGLLTERLSSLHALDVMATAHPDAFAGLRVEVRNEGFTDSPARFEYTTEGRTMVVSTGASWLLGANAKPSEVGRLYAATVVHETGHLLTYEALGRDGEKFNDLAWAERATVGGVEFKRGESVSTYGESNIAESIAESFAASTLGIDTRPPGRGDEQARAIAAGLGCHTTTDSLAYLFAIAERAAPGHLASVMTQIQRTVTAAGDLPGHPFRGNQYVDGSGSGATAPDPQEFGLALTKYQQGMTWGTPVFSELGAAVKAVSSGQSVKATDSRPEFGYAGGQAQLVADAKAIRDGMAAYSVPLPGTVYRGDTTEVVDRMPKAVRDAPSTEIEYRHGTGWVHGPTGTVVPVGDERYESIPPKVGDTFSAGILSFTRSKAVADGVAAFGVTTGSENGVVPVPPDRRITYELHEPVGVVPPNDDYAGEREVLAAGAFTATDVARADDGSWRVKLEQTPLSVTGSISPDDIVRDERGRFASHGGAGTPGIRLGEGWPRLPRPDNGQPDNGYRAPDGNVTLPSGRTVSLQSSFGDASAGEYHAGNVMLDKATGDQVGRIDYTIAGDTLHVDWVESTAPGEHVADTLLAYTLADANVTRVDPGMQTPEGDAWWSKVEPEVRAAGYAVGPPAEDPDSLTATAGGALAASVPAIIAGDLPGHPFRGNQWTDGSGNSKPMSAKMLTEAAERKGGLTYDPEVMRLATHGAVVAIPGHSQRFTTERFHRRGEDDLANFVATMDQRGVKPLDGGRYGIGVWHDTETVEGVKHNEIVLDPVEIITKATHGDDYLQVGVALGAQRGEQGVYHLDNDEYIPTGGDGGRTDDSLQAALALVEKARYAATHGHQPRADRDGAAEEPGGHDQRRDRGLRAGDVGGDGGTRGGSGEPAEAPRLVEEHPAVHRRGPGQDAELSVAAGVLARIAALQAAVLGSIDPADIVRDERGRFASKDGGESSGPPPGTQPRMFQGFVKIELAVEPTEAQHKIIAEAIESGAVYSGDGSTLGAFRMVVGNRGQISDTLKSEDPDPTTVVMLQLTHASAEKIAADNGFTHLWLERGTTDHAANPGDPFGGNEGERYSGFGAPPEGATYTPGTSGVTSWSLHDEVEGYNRPPGVHWGDHGHVATVPMDQVVGRLGLIPNEMLVARDPAIVTAIMAWPNDVDGVPAAPFNTFPERLAAKTASIDPEDIVRDERGRFASKGGEDITVQPPYITFEKTLLPKVLTDDEKRILGDEPTRIARRFDEVVGGRPAISDALKSEDPDPVTVTVLQMTHRALTETADDIGFDHLLLVRGADTPDPFAGNIPGGFPARPSREPRHVPTSGVTSWRVFEGGTDPEGPVAGYGDHVTERPFPVEQVIGRAGILSGEMLVARDPAIVSAIMAWPNDVDGVPAAPFNTFPERLAAKTASIDPEDIVRDERGRFTFKDGGAAGSVDAGVAASRRVPYDPHDLAAPPTESSLSRYVHGGKLDPEREKIHDDIVAKVIAGATPVKDPEFILMGGGPATGKTTALSLGVFETHPNSVVVENDRIKAMLPEGDAAHREADPRGWAPIVHAEAGHITERSIVAAVTNRCNVVLDAVGNTSMASVEGKLDEAKAAGYRTRGEYMTIPTPLAVERAEARLQREGRGVPTSEVLRMHAGVSAMWPQMAAAQTFDKLNLWDTSGSPGEKHLVASAEGGKITVHDQAVFEDFLAKAKA